LKRLIILVVAVIAATVLIAVFNDELVSINPIKFVNNLLYGAKTPSAAPRSPASPARSVPPKSGQAQAHKKLVLATWNLRMLSSNSRSDEDIAKICEILARFDLVAMQEVLDMRVLDRCRETMAAKGLERAYLLSTAVGTSTHKEHYAFFYDPAVVSPDGKADVVADPGDRFIREPYHCSFQSGNFDFTLITVHILYGSGKKDPKRLAELDAIADVFNAIQAEDPKENDVILTGDFNEEPNSPRFHSLGSIPTISFLVMKVKTVIFDSSIYDQIIWQKQYTGYEYTGDWEVVKFDEEMFGNKDEVASAAVSDHRPVWASFNTDEQDDD